LYTWAGAGTGEDESASSVKKNTIASFGVDSALVPVGTDVEFHCRVTRIDGGSFVQLSKTVPGTLEQETLTTNMIKERSIDDIDRYSIAAEQYGESGYDFVLRITSLITF